MPWSCLFAYIKNNSWKKWSVCQFTDIHELIITKWFIYIVSSRLLSSIITYYILLESQLLRNYSLQIINHKLTPGSFPNCFLATTQFLCVNIEKNFHIFSNLSLQLKHRQIHCGQRRLYCTDLLCVCVCVLYSVLVCM